MIDVKTIVLIVISALLGAAGQIFFKKAAPTFALDIKSLISNYNLLIGGLLYIIATVIYLYALKKIQVFIGYGIIATSYIWTAVFAQLFLGEYVSVLGWAGVFFILFGVVLLSL